MDVESLWVDLLDMGARFNRIETTVEEVHDHVVRRHVTEKESYTTADVAKLQGTRPFPVRE